MSKEKMKRDNISKRSMKIAAIALALLMIIVFFFTTINYTNNNDITTNQSFQPSSFQSNSNANTSSYSLFSGTTHTSISLHCADSSNIPGKEGVECIAPYASIYDPENHNMLVFSYIYDHLPNFPFAVRGDSISVISPQGIFLKFIPFNAKGNLSPPGPDVSAAFDQTTGNVYMASSHYSNLSVFNSTTCLVTDTIPVGNHPINITVDQNNGYLYVVNSNSNNISVIDPFSMKVITSISVGSDPNNAIYVPANGMIYVTNGGSNNISVINPQTNKVSTSIQTGSDPKQMILLNNDIYLNNQNSGTISIINTTDNSIVKDIKLPFDAYNSSTAIVYDEESNSIYLLGFRSPGFNEVNVTIISVTSQRILTTIEIGIGTQAFFGYLNMNLDFSNNSLIIYNNNGGFIAINLSSSSATTYHFPDNGFTLPFTFLYNPQGEKELVIEGTYQGGYIHIFSLSIKNTSIPYQVSKIFLIIIAVISIAGVIIFWRRHKNKKYKDYAV